MNFFTLKLKIRSFFVKKPSRELLWNTKDFSLAKKWAKSKPHPFLKDKTLWDFCKIENDNVYILQILNKSLHF